MSVLVGIVSKNRSSILPKAIDAALMQTGSSIQVAVFDDHSSDDTFSLKAKYPNIQWTFSDVSRGYVFARNKFMRESRSKYFCSLDDDSWFLDPGTLANAVQYMDNNLDVAALAFDILSPDKPKGLPKGMPIEVANFIGCGHVLRLDPVRQVGYYEPNPLFYGSEEKDLCLKLIDAGYKTMFMPGEYVWHEKTMVARDLMAQHRSAVCNDLVFAYRRLPLLFFLPGVILKIMRHLAFSVRHQDQHLVKPTIQGVGKFLGLFILGRLKRLPVKRQSFLKFNRLNKKFAF